MQIRKFEPYFLAAIGLVGCCWFAGAVLFELVGADVLESRPWSIVQYAGYSDLPVYWIAVAAGVAPPLMLGLLMVMPKPEKLHGDAKWASAANVKKAGMRASAGILLGRFRGKYLMTDAPAHFLVCAPTRSGKGVGIIIPNLLSFDGSAIVYDIKLENWKFTSGFRAAHGHKVFLWSPMNPDGTTHSYNPLDRIRDDALFRITDVQALTSYLIPLPKKDPIWDQLARFFLGGLILYTLDSAKERGTKATIGEIYRTLNNTSDLREWIRSVIDEPWLDPECRRLFLSYAGMTDKERSFVKTSISKALNLWSNPLVDAATSRSDFDLGDLRRKRMAIYIGVTADTKDTVAPIVALFFQQAIAALAQREPGKDEPHKVLLLMDEFASLGRMEMIANAVTMLASYGGRMMFILQALSTLDEHYGKEGREVIVQNCAFQVFFAASDKTTTDYVVSRLGKKTVKVTSKTKSKGGHFSQSTNDQSRDLMLPQEFQQMDRAKQVVLVEASRPVLSDKIEYHKDDDFTSRVLKAPPVPKVKISGSAVLGTVQDAEQPETPSKSATKFLRGAPPDDLKPKPAPVAAVTTPETPSTLNDGNGAPEPAKPAEDRAQDNGDTQDDGSSGLDAHANAAVTEDDPGKEESGFTGEDADNVNVPADPRMNEAAAVDAVLVNLTRIDHSAVREHQARMAAMEAAVEAEVLGR